MFDPEKLINKSQLAEVLKIKRVSLDKKRISKRNKIIVESLKNYIQMWYNNNIKDYQNLLDNAEYQLSKGNKRQAIEFYKQAKEATNSFEKKIYLQNNIDMLYISLNEIPES